MNLLAIISNIRFPDVLDILFISIVSYHLYQWFWGTKAFKALMGILLLSGVFTLAKLWGLFLTTWVFQIMWQVFVILLIILFQKEIRQMLEKFNPGKVFGLKSATDTSDWLPFFTKWVIHASQKKIGAVIIFERADLLDDLTTKGILLESDPLPEVLNSIFIKESPLHDGAVLIRQGKILKASCYLSLTKREDLPSKMGTRHRAALGLTEQSDALVIIVSEETGEISFSKNSDIQTIKSENHLHTVIEDEMQFGNESKNVNMKEKILSWFTSNYKVKAVVFLTVFLIWMVLAGQQNFEKKISIHLNIHNVPDSLLVQQPDDQQMTITFRGLRKDVSVLNKNNVQSNIDFSLVKPGKAFYNITKHNLLLPNDRIHIVNIKPSRLELKVKNE